MASTAETVLNYLKEQNRPYSSTDVFNNLHKAIGRAILQRDLESLVESGEVAEKTYGKQKIYYASQDNKVASTDEELAGMDRDIETLSDEVSSKTKHVKDLEAQLEALNSSMSSEDCRREILRYKSRNQDLEKQIKRLESGGPQKIDPFERAALSKKKDLLSSELKKRKKIHKDALSIISENHPNRKEDLFDEIGLQMK